MYNLHPPLLSQHKAVFDDDGYVVIPVLDKWVRKTDGFGRFTRWTLINHEWIAQRRNSTECHHTAMLTMCVRRSQWRVNNATNWSKILYIHTCSWKNEIKTCCCLVWVFSMTSYKVVNFAVVHYVKICLSLASALIYIGSINHWLFSTKVMVIIDMVEGESESDVSSVIIWICRDDDNATFRDDCRIVDEDVS